MNRKFNFNWFEGQIPLFNHFLSPLKGKENLQFLEIGSFEGYSTCWCLDNVLTHDKSMITCIDSWEGGFEHEHIKMQDIEMQFLTNISERLDSVEILKGNSRKGLLSIQSRVEFYDFIYIDGGHTLKDVITDAILAFPLLKKGGIMAFDDYTWGSTEFNISKRPQGGIDAFLVGWSEELEILHMGYQVWIKKK